MVAAIDPDDLPAVREDHDTLLVDVRASADFERGHIPDSENVPLGTIPEHSDAIADRDPDRIVTVCAHGIASQQGARLLAAHGGIDGDHVYNLTGGIDAWDGPVTGTAVDAE
ncbi:rhodanese-like domain-containing protein [Halococcoides cellulosivorans]|uniref:Rhodanese-like domain-containing protein n=1 Tax=Halococcoides cellulosivorans TaxID=1679096 RepID=A0A2R4X350_9EURY|nr:rhodanese-like domain-containing protein [Halococcoides cellulosivorans]AWB28217.1 rhodanese-like domain-containing protein [Halococcoides cellulosivorans]